MSTSVSPLAALRAHLVTLGLDGAVIPRFDAHQGENCAPHDERLRFLTGFSGSAGIALVTADRAVIFVDGRYQVQVRHEVDTDAFEIGHFYDFPIERWLATELPSGRRIGVNPMLVPSGLYARLAAAMQAGRGELVPLDADPIDAVWPDQPPPPLARVTAFSRRFAGESSADKRRRLGARIAEAGAELLVEAQPDNIAWLLNVRGGDAPTTTTPHGFLVLDTAGGVEWFVDERKLPNDRTDFELDGVTLRAPADLLGRIEAVADGRRVVVDPDFAPVAARLAVERGGGAVVAALSPITIAKALKNDTELSGFRESHVTDGVAWTEFFAWLHDNVPAREAAGSPITELEAEAVLLTYREAGADFHEPSFRSISAAGANAAMCHYNSSPSTDAPITSKGVYLLDSGGHYYTGTTDATRTTAFAPVPDQVRAAYTAVLKGFIALMSVQFPVGTSGHQLDAMARRPLWDLGLDYDHGTGHGVGHFLNIHEHPHRFSKTVNTHGLADGVIMTVEPGYYLEGKFGLRIENQVETVTGAPGFLRFETLTLVPIDLRLADVSALTAFERDYVNAYHARVRAALTGRLSSTAETRLQQWTAPV